MADVSAPRASNAVKREVQECRQIAEELQRRVLSLVDDPHRQQLLAVDHLGDALFDVAPQLSPLRAIGRPVCRPVGE